MTPVLKGCRIVLVLAFLCPVCAWSESPIGHEASYMVKQRAAQERYEKSLRLCYQKFAVSDCKQEAIAVLNAELSPLKKSEAEHMQRIRAQNTQEKMQSLAKKAPMPDVQMALPTKKITAADSGAGTNSKSPQEEHVQRKRFEEKQLRAQQHRDAVEKRWVDKKGLIASEISTSP
jgi:hypothetical protein